MNPKPENASGQSLVWQEEFKIPSADIDFNGKLKFHSLCAYLFDIASSHANHLHFGFKDLEQTNYYWVLSRLHVKVNQSPGFDQKIVIETWHKGIGRLFGLRDYRILNVEGQVMAIATSAWLILEKSTGRPVKPDKFPELVCYKTEHHAIKEIPDKLDSLENHDKELLILPGYTDLDINCHVNAGRYIAWIQDLFPLDFYNNYQICEFQINYMNETRFEEKVRIFLHRESNEDNMNFRIEGRINGTDIPAFRAVIKWKELKIIS